MYYRNKYTEEVCVLETVWISLDYCEFSSRLVVLDFLVTAVAQFDNRKTALFFSPVDTVQSSVGDPPVARYLLPFVVEPCCSAIVPEINAGRVALLDIFAVSGVVGQ